MDLRVRAAYADVARQYVDLVAGDAQADSADAAFVRRHLVGLPGPLLDLGCGPGQWTADLHARGADVTGVDMVPAFIEQARKTYPGPAFRLCSMTHVALPPQSVAGILSWYSTIHHPPVELPHVLARFHRLLAPGGVLVIGFFDSQDDVAAFDHKVVTAYRWPVEVLADRLAQAGFIELERLQEQHPERPDRRYAALAARTT